MSNEHQLYIEPNFPAIPSRTESGFASRNNEAENWELAYNKLLPKANEIAEVLKELRATSNQALEENTRLHDENTKLTAETARLTAEKDKLNLAEAGLAQRYHDAVNDLENMKVMAKYYELTDMEAEIGRLSAELRVREVTVRECYNKIATLEGQLIAFRETTKKMCAEIERVGSELERLGAENTRLSEELSESHASSARVEAALKELMTMD
jgi:regulator of replication initiation timing